MEFGYFAAAGIVILVGVAALSRRFGVAAPIALVLVGVGLSYLPGVPAIEVPHEWVLDGVLPPILYAAAISVPVIDFRRNLGTIASLSVALVVVTAFAVGFLLFTMLPDLNLAAAIALGAIISPPDAVAATSIGRRLGLPPRILTVLEGEGLVNDATALVLLRSAVAVAAGGVLSPWAIGADFLYAVVIAIIVGLLAGMLTVYVRSKLSDSVLDTAISIAVPFIAFMPAEALHGSGVLAVVVAGLYTGHVAPRRLSPQARISDRINWRTIQFLLESAVFLVIGLELRTLIEHVDPTVLTAGASIGIGLIAVLALTVLRFAWIGPMMLSLKWRAQRAEKSTFRLRLVLDQSATRWTALHGKRRERAERVYAARRADLEHQRHERIDWRGGIVLGWSGMRGVVTLAAAQSLPENTPYRSQLILIAFTVAVVTLVGQGATLPALIRLLRIRGADDAQDHRDLAKLLDELSYAGLVVLEDTSEIVADPVDPDILERVRQSSFLRAEAAWERAREAEATPNENPHRTYRELRLAVVAAERTKLLEARRGGEYPSRILARAEALLDAEDTRLRPAQAEH